MILFLVLAVLAAMIIIAFRGVFSAYLTAYEISEKDIGIDVKIQKEVLDEAYEWLTTKDAVPLQIR